MDASLSGDGAMIVSGVLRAEREHVLSVFDAAGWLLTDEIAEAEWWSASFERAT
jgi:ribosomal protein L11 methylase PrmA